MDLCTLTNELTIRGLTPTLNDGKLAIAGPTEKITPPLKAALAEHRDTLRAMLAPKDDAPELPPENADGVSDIAFADTPEADAGLLKVANYFGKLAAAVLANNPSHAANLTADPRGEPCRRCGFEPAVLTLIQDGSTVRRDCATCGAFCEFSAWNNADAAARTMADARAEFRREVAEAKAEPACLF